MKVSKIVNLADDLALALSALSIRIVAPIPGKSVVGIEVPNTNRETAFLKEIIDSDPFRGSKSKLSFGLGKDYLRRALYPRSWQNAPPPGGRVNRIWKERLHQFDDLQRPFQSNSRGRSGFLIDPKMLELSNYEDIPHLLLPVVTNPKKAAIALKWLVNEMERRYNVLAEKGVRNIEHYHQRIEKELKEKGKIYKRKGNQLEGGEEKAPEEMEWIPYIVVVIDELADLMMISSREVEESITRLAQMARAVGIHLLLATQRPSVDVLTGHHQSQFPCSDLLSGHFEG